MLPYLMLLSQSDHSPSPSPGISFLRDSFFRPCRCGALAPRVFARFVFSSKLFRIRISKKHASNYRRIRTFKTQDLKPFKMCTSKKNGRGEGVLLLTSYPIRIAVPRSNATRDLSTPDDRRFRPCRKASLRSLRRHLCVITSVVRSPKGGPTQPNPSKNAKIDSYLGGDSVSTEAVAARRHAGTHLPVTWWKLEMPTTTWHLLLN